MKVTGRFRGIPDHRTVSNDISYEIDAASNPHLSKFGEYNDGGEDSFLAQKDSDRMTTILVMEAEQIW
jgi:hypothetical protein